MRVNVRASVLPILFVMTPILIAGCGRSASTTAAQRAARSDPGGTTRTGPPVPTLFAARGLYATGWSAGLSKKMDHLIRILHETGMNSLVIDVKDSDGIVSYYTPGVPLAVAIGACSKRPRANPCADINGVLKKLKDEHIHVIARIACFNDPILARKRPSWAILSVNGGLWRNRKGQPWVDPTLKEVWQYNIDLAKDAIQRGFDEIQWDYVRMPTEGNTRLCKYHNMPKGTDRVQVITDYLDFAQKSLASYGVPISADIFGLTGTATSDMGIGQRLKPISDYVNYVSPMVYPSHFAHGEYHEPNPNAQPYRTVFLSLRDARKRLETSHTGVRPWLQAFSLGSPRYGPAQFLEELKAVRDNHLPGFLCWNAGNNYEMVDAALQSAEGKKLMAALDVNDSAPAPPLSSTSEHSPSPTKQVGAAGPAPIDKPAAGSPPKGGMNNAS